MNSQQKLHLHQLLGAVLFAAGVALAPATRAEVGAHALEQMYKQASDATVILQFYFEGEEGRHIERDAMATIVNDSGLAITSIDYFPANTRFEDFKGLVMLIGNGANRKQVPAEIVGRDDDRKVAFLRPTADKNQPLKLDYIHFTPTELKVGDELIVFGEIDKAFDYLRNLNVGRVSAVLEKPTKMYCPTLNARGVLGTPVFDATGQAIGLAVNYSTTRRGLVREIVDNRRVEREGDVTVTLPVVLPTERFAVLIAKPPTGGNQIAWLGITALQPLPADLARHYNVSQCGVVIGQVVKDGPAGKAGLQAEDIVLKYGETELTQAEEKVVEILSQAIQQSAVGKPLNVVIWRPSTKSQIILSMVPVASPKTAAEAEQ